jgi:hypothetical protein
MALMSQLRRWHTFLGCFFAPLLLFFVCSGWYQTWHPDRRKAPGEAEAFADRMRAVHADSLLPSTAASGYGTKPFRLLVAVMSAAMIATVTIGIVLAFRFSKTRWPIWASLLLGFALPLLILWLGQRK